jgi:hypothetical protein
MTLENNNADATGAIIKFLKDGASAADNDKMGELQFYGEDDAGNKQEFGNITVTSPDVSTTAELGKIALGVACSDDGGVDTCLTITGGAAAASSTVAAAGHLTVGGNLTVSGTTTTVDSTTVATGDSMIKLAKDQGTSADAIDFGLYGVYGVGGTAKYAGIFRDASATGDPWTFFDTLEDDPTTTVDIGGTNYDLADISAGKITSADGFVGALTGNASTATTAATVTTAAQGNITSLGTLTGLTVASATSASPVIHITNTNADGTSGELRFNKDSASGADNDVMGKISFYGTDDDDATHEELAYIDSYIVEASEGTEAAGMRFYVAENDGTRTQGLALTGQASADGEIDVTIGAGAASTATVAGDLAVTGSFNPSALAVGGGYGSTGATITGAGALSIDGAFQGASTGNFDGTLTANTSLTLDTTTITTAELGVLDGVTVGTVAASKAVTVDASKDVGTIRNLTIDGTFSDGNYTFDTSGNVSSLGTVGCGAITSSGAIASTNGALAMSDDLDSEFVGIVLTNQSDAADTTGSVSVRFDLEDTAGTAVDAGKILVSKEASFTSTTSTQDSNMEFYVSLNGTLTEKASLSSAGVFVASTFSGSGASLTSLPAGNLTGTIDGGNF